VLRGVFVPKGEQPPPEFASDFRPLRIPATRDPATGQITCHNAGISFGGDLLAHWYPDEDQGSDEGDEAPDQNDDSGTGGPYQGGLDSQRDPTWGGQSRKAGVGLPARPRGRPGFGPSGDGSGGGSTDGSPWSPGAASPEAAGGDGGDAATPPGTGGDDANADDDRRDAAIPPARTEQGRTSPYWPGYGGDTAKLATSFGAFALAGSKTSIGSLGGAAVVPVAAAMPASGEPVGPRGVSAGQTDQTMQFGEGVGASNQVAADLAIRDTDGSGSGPSIKQSAGSALSRLRDPSHSATGASGVVLVSELRSKTPAPLKDDKGASILNADGGQMMLPSDADPHFFIDAGKLYGLPGLANFRQGGPWDLQRVGPDRMFIKDFTDFSTVAIGLYGAAAGIPADTLLSIQDRYAAGHSNFGPAKMDAKYTHLAEKNVWNTRLGYDLYSSGRIGASSTGAAILKYWPPQ
jgi:hypothetical protein